MYIIHKFTSYIDFQNIYIRIWGHDSKLQTYSKPSYKFLSQFSLEKLTYNTMQTKENQEANLCLLVKTSILENRELGWSE